MPATTVRRGIPRRSRRSESAPDRQEAGRRGDAEHARVDGGAPQLSHADLGEQGRPPRADEPLGPDRGDAGDREEPQVPQPEHVPRPRCSDARAAAAPPGVGHEATDQGRGDEREHRDDEEDLPPRHELAERAAQQHPEGGADAQPRERHALPHREPVGRGRGRDDRPVVGEVHPLGEAGDEARQHEDGQRGRQARGEGRRRDQEDARDQHALPAEPVAQESAGTCIATYP